jgi:hypothetical protein
MMTRKIFLRSTTAAMAILFSAAAFAANGTNFDQLPEPVRKSIKAMAPDIAPNAIKIKAGRTRDTLVEFVDRGLSWRLRQTEQSSGSTRRYATGPWRRTPETTGSLMSSQSTRTSLSSLSPATLIASSISLLT